MEGEAFAPVGWMLWVLVLCKLPKLSWTMLTQGFTSQDFDSAGGTMAAWLAGSLRKLPHP